MSAKYLGASFDFHGGGSDLIFPHHENEIAQSEAYTGCEPFVRYWIHNGFITVNQEKMSKSLNNFFLVKDILEHFPAETVRFFLVSTHYRSPLDFSDERLAESSRSLERLRTAIENLQYLVKQPATDSDADSAALANAAEQARKDFEAAMDDDFNTALAASVLFGLAKEINIYYSKLDGKAGCDQTAVAAARDVYYLIADILGILTPEREGKVQGDNGLAEQLMDIIIAIRQQARQKKDWPLADSIRDQLSAAGIVLEDSPQGVRWKKR